MDEQTNGHTPEQPVSRLDIIYLFQAYNRGEFPFDELIQRTRSWGEAMKRQYAQADKNAKSSPKPAAPD